MDKQMMACPYYGMLLSNKKEWISDTDSMDETRNHYAEFSGKKENILYDSTYIKFQKIQSSSIVSVVAWGTTGE